VTQLFNGEDFELGDTLVNNLGNRLVLTDYFIILSEFNLVSEGVLFAVADSTQTNCGTNSSNTNYQIDDLVLIDNNTDFVTVGPWRHAGQFVDIGYLVGLSNCYQDAGIDNIQAGSRIADIDTLHASGLGFNTMRFEFNDSLRIDFVGKSATVASSNRINATNIAGSPMVLNMEIDFEQWLFGIDLTEDIQLTKDKLINKAGLVITFAQ